VAEVVTCDNPITEHVAVSRAAIPRCHLPFAFILSVLLCGR
jgi:hypothetical protein